MSRLTPQPARTVLLPLSARVASAPGRHQFYTVRIAGGEAVPAFKSSGDITSMSQADGYIEIAASENYVEKGTVVEVKLF
jgi:molybdopterin biosynthesis enzyme